MTRTLKPPKLKQHKKPWLFIELRLLHALLLRREFILVFCEVAILVAKSFIDNVDTGSLFLIKIYLNLWEKKCLNPKCFLYINVFSSSFLNRKKSDFYFP